jgi:hypothetical protein
VDIRKKLRERFESSFGRSKGAYTIGVEQEFFLLDNRGYPVAIKQSQAFLSGVSKRPGWHIREYYEADSNRYVWRVSRDVPQRGFVALKYDHPPHLMELASSVHTDPLTLAQELHECFDVIDSVCSGLGLVRLKSPFLDLPAADESVTSNISDYIALREVRAKIVRDRGEDADADALNYAAVIAATQVHIGSSDALNDSIIGRLYRYEPYLFQRFSKNLEADWVSRRWSGFNTIFERTPLGAFPNLNDWSVNNWIEALMRAPLKLAKGSPIQGKSLTEIGKSPFGDNLGELVASFRDLQLIRPKLHGALEFRSAPASDDVHGIIDTVRVRLACFEMARAGYSPPITFREARKYWYGIVRGECQPGDLPSCSDFNAVLDSYLRQQVHRETA